MRQPHNAMLMESAIAHRLERMPRLVRIKRERLCAEADSPLSPARDVGEVLAIGDL